MAKVKKSGLPAKPLVLLLILGMGAGLLLGYYLSRPSAAPIPPAGQPPIMDGFCGRSTGGACSPDSDCLAGGCSGQVCQSRFEEPIGTTCEWRDCYDSKKSGARCGCVNAKCQWSK